MGRPTIDAAGDESNSETELEITIDKGNKQWVAVIGGADSQYGYDRDFVSPYGQGTETTTVADGTVVEKCWHSHSGNEKGREYYVVVAGRLCEIDDSDVERALDATVVRIDDDSVAQDDADEDEIDATAPVVVADDGNREYDDRVSTSIPEDVAAFVPDDAEAVVELPTEPTPKLYLTDERQYSTGVHCRRCFCDVAVTERGTGETWCPNCEPRDDSDADDGPSTDDVKVVTDGGHDRPADTAEADDRADELREQGGVPERRAEAIALIERGCTHAEVADELGIERPGVAKHVRRYRAEHTESGWLAEHGPDI